LTPALINWIWDDERKLRERARATVARLKDAKERPESSQLDAKPPKTLDKPKPSIDPFRIAFDNFKRSPDDLAELKRRIKLYGQYLREESAKIGFQP
jgi:hypothetical protein